MQIRKVDTLLKDTLVAHCPTVARLYTNKKPATFSTYQMLNAASRDYADDRAQGDEYYYRIDIYSKKDYLTLVENLIKDLKSKDFYGIEITSETYESELGYYHISIELYFFDYESEEE